MTRDQWTSAILERKQSRRCLFQAVVIEIGRCVAWTTATLYG
jgi:hypothetical protein